jgi:hypothetical protein
MFRRKSHIPVFIKKINKFSSVKEQAFNFMWDGINWKRGGGVNILLKHN